MADWDEEIKRQAAISALLAPPEDQSSLDTWITPESDTAAEHPDKSDWHKLASQIFDQPNISPPPPLNIPTPTPESPSGSTVPLKTDEDTGTRYVEDEGTKIPHAELATPADEAAFKPSDVVLPQIDVSGRGAPIRVERGEELTEPWHPAGQDLRIPQPTPESPSGPVPTPPKPVPGFVEGSQNAIVNPAAGVTPQTPVAPATTQLPNAPITPPAATQLPNAPITPPDQSRLQVTQPVVGGQGFFGGDLSQGPPGTKPDGTDDEPYWPKTDKDVALLPPGVNYIDPKDQSQKVTPGTPIAAPVATPAGTPAVAVADQPSIQPSSEDWDKLVNSTFPSAESKTKTAAAPAGPVTMANPDGTPIPERIQAVGGNDPAAIIIHHTGDHHTAAQTKAVLDQRGLGVELTVDRDGNITQIGDPGAANIKTGWGPKGTGLNNSNVIGIEVAANDDGDVLPVQIQAVKNYLAARGYGNIPVYGHGEVNPGHKEADEGMTIVNSIRADRASGTTSTGEPGTTPIETLVRLDQSGINVTHFGYEKPGEEGYDKDSANGNGKYVKNLISGYDVALNSAGAALVGNPKPGETFTFAGKEWRYGDAASEKFKDPRFDIFDPSGAALTGSMPVGKSIAAPESKESQSLEDLAKDWVKLSPEGQTAGQKQNIATLDNLNQSNQNPGEFWKIISKHIDGIPDDLRQQYADNFKKEVVKYAQDFYNEKDPEKAFARATSDPGFDAYVGNVGRGLAGAVGQADIGIALAGKSIDRNRVDGFMNLVHPDSTGEGRAGFVKALTDIQDTRHRHDVFNEIYGALPQNTKDAIGDPASILDSIDHLADPKYQAQLNKTIATKKAWVDQQLAGSPELRGTSAGWWTTGTGENLFNTVAALVPGGVGAVVRTTTLGAQMYSANMDRIAKEHPDYSPEQVSEEASKSAFMTLAPQEAVLAASHGLTAPLLKWAGALAEKPIVRFGIGGGVQVGAAAVGGVAGQVGMNVAENKPILQDVPQAVGSAVMQALPFAVHGGLGALSHEPVVKAPEALLGEHGPPIERVPIDTGAEHGPPIEAIPTDTGKLHGPGPLLDTIHGPRDVTLAGEEHGPARPLSPVRGADILGPENVAPPQGERWYDPGPITTRGIERTAFSPQELSEVVTRLSEAGYSPDQLRQVLSQLRPGYEQGIQSVHFNPEAQNLKGPQEPPIPVKLPAGEAQRFAPQWTAQPEPLRAAVSPHYIEPLDRAIARQRAAASLGGVPPPATSRAKFFPTPAHTAVYNDLVSRGMDEARARDYVNQARGVTQAEILADVQIQMRGRGEQPPPQPGNISGEEPGIQREANKSTAHGVIDELTKGVANKYAEERMKAGELDPIDPNTGLTTEELMARALKMRPQEVQNHINNFMENRGGDPRDHAASVRARETFLTDRNRALSLKADSNPHDVQARSEAAVARKALNDFYTKGGPISKMKELFHVHGKGLQGEPSIDLSTEGGLHDKFLRETNRPPPPSAKPRLKKVAERVRTTHSDEYKARDKVDKAIDKDGRKKIPSIEEVRDHIAKRMTQMPCRK